MGSVVQHKARSFAINIIELYKYLKDKQKEYVLSDQVLRSGTSIGANISEAQYSQSRKDFLYKMQVSLKEASETLYWLELLHESGYIDDIKYKELEKSCSELLKILTAITKTTAKQLAASKE